MTPNILHIEIQPARVALDRFGAALEDAMTGQSIAPYCGVGFETMAQLGEVFTPKQWELIEALKAAGPLTIYALAKHLGRGETDNLMYSPWFKYGLKVISWKDHTCGSGFSLTFSVFNIKES